MSKEYQQVNPYPIRLTKELRERLEASAKEASRSLNAEMIRRLEASYAMPDESDEVTLTASQIRQLIQEEIAKAVK
ncbi:MAG: hypothetical protein BWK73_36070 [Thiothrix lacustris]|uniref:Arc-like DNA binding domain-containing protein n=1 Tax=Thiothrix lacustris TaxID=525917 RepID=A0A1Y1QFP8_9GAMM|nr:MAG: hypothetical protein BWK73_36070 [Thiothrix lacustris]